jgi:hypothetical protein
MGEKGVLDVVDDIAGGFDESSLALGARATDSSDTALSRSSDSRLLGPASIVFRSRAFASHLAHA